MCGFTNCSCQSVETCTKHYKGVFPQLSECGLLRNIGQNYPPNGIFYVSSRGDSHRLHTVKISQPRFKDKQTDGYWSQLGHVPVTGVYFNRQKIQWLHLGGKSPQTVFEVPLSVGGNVAWHPAKAHKHKDWITPAQCPCCGIHPICHNKEEICKVTHTHTYRYACKCTYACILAHVFLIAWQIYSAVPYAILSQK